MRILVIGGGRREHALCWRIRRDRPEAELYVVPGNGGTEAEALLQAVLGSFPTGAIIERGDPRVVLAGL